MEINNVKVINCKDNLGGYEDVPIEKVSFRPSAYGFIFDKGKIVDEGTHADLLNKGGLYAKMWNMQVGGFLPEEPT